MKRTKLVILYGYDLSGGGGAERRFLRLFEKIKSIDKSIFVIINERLYSSAYSLNLITNENVLIYKDEKYFNRVKFAFFAFIESWKKKSSIIHLVLIQKDLYILYLLLPILKFLRDSKIVLTVASYLYAYNIKLSLPQRFIYNYLIMVSNTVDSLYPLIKKKSNKIVISPCSFTDLKPFYPTDKRKIVLFSGRLISEKNPLLFVEAIKDFSDLFPELASSWSFIINGDGPLKSEIIELIEKYKLKDTISLTKGDSFNCMRESSVFVSIQQLENYPSQSLLEAIWTNNAIIVTDVGSTRKIANDSFALLIKDRSEFVFALREVCSNPELFINRTIEFKNRVFKVHNIENFVLYLNTIWRKYE